MAAYHELDIEQGATFTDELLTVDDAGNVINLTGYTARLDIKRDAQEAAALISLTTTNGRIIITPATGSVLLYLTATETAALTTWRSGVYDLELVSAGGEVIRLAAGPVTIWPNVTI